MPKVKLHVDGEILEQEVKENANLVVLAGIRQFPKLKYGCGMGKCTKCASKILDGADYLGLPNWKEKKILGEKLEEGYRLICQVTIKQDIELSQNEQIEIKKKKKFMDRVSHL